MDQITLTRPDDWHIHLRDGPYLKQTVTDASRVFGRVLAMPNLDPPVINSLIARQYRDKIMRFARTEFYPLFALYLTEKTPRFIPKKTRLKIFSSAVLRVSNEEHLI